MSNCDVQYAKNNFERSIVISPMSTIILSAVMDGSDDDVQSGVEDNADNFYDLIQLFVYEIRKMSSIGAD